MRRPRPSSALASTALRPPGRSSRAAETFSFTTSIRNEPSAPPSELTLPQTVTTSVGLDEALAADLVVTVTPGHEVLLPEGSLRPGQHVSLMGADGPGKAEIAVDELLRTRIFADDWEQASHNGELVHAVEPAGSSEAADRARRGARRRRAGTASDEEITTFDSTGLAIQDLAIALAAIEREDELDLPTLEL